MHIWRGVVMGYWWQPPSIVKRIVPLGKTFSFSASCTISWTFSRTFLYLFWFVLQPICWSCVLLLASPPVVTPSSLQSSKPPVLLPLIETTSPSHDTVFTQSLFFLRKSGVFTWTILIGDGNRTKIETVGFGSIQLNFSEPTRASQKSISCFFIANKPGLQRDNGWCKKVDWPACFHPDGDY